MKCHTERFTTKMILFDFESRTTSLMNNLIQEIDNMQ